MSSVKKIGLFACTGVVAGNMMGSGIALLPANLASIGGIAIWGWVISIIGAMSLAYVYARLATKNPQQGGPIAYAGEISPAFGFQTGVLYYHANWIGNLAIGITAVSYLSTFFPALIIQYRQVLPVLLSSGCSPLLICWAGPGSAA